MNGETALIVDSIENCLEVPTFLDFLRNTAATTLLQEGTYVIKISSGKFSFGSHPEGGEPFVLLFLFSESRLFDSFINLQTNVSTFSTSASLNGYEDKLTIEVKRDTTLSAFFIDNNKADNIGQINLSIVKQ